MTLWTDHVKSYQAAHPGMSYKAAMSASRSSYKKVKRGAGIGDWLKKGKDLIVGKVGTAVRNFISRNPKSKPLFAGEAHAIELSGKYKGSSYNFMGPGTHVQERVRRGDRGINAPDEVARRHDIDYTLIPRMKNEKQRIQAEVGADKKFLAGIRPYLNLPEVKIAYAAIAGKMAGQLSGKLRWGLFTKGQGMITRKKPVGAAPYQVIASSSAPQPNHGPAEEKRLADIHKRAVAESLRAKIPRAPPPPGPISAPYKPPKKVRPIGPARPPKFVVVKPSPSKPIPGPWIKVPSKPGKSKKKRKSNRKKKKPKRYSP